MFHERTKHIHVKFHFIQDVIGKYTMTVKKIGTINNPVNIMTKPLPIAKFKHWLNLVSIVVEDILQSILMEMGIFYYFVFENILI